MDKGMRCMLFHSSTVCVCVRVSWLIVHGKTGVVIMYIIGKVTLCVTTITARASEMNHETAILPKIFHYATFQLSIQFTLIAFTKLPEKCTTLECSGFGCAVCHPRRRPFHSKFRGL